MQRVIHFRGEIWSYACRIQGIYMSCRMVYYKIDRLNTAKSTDETLQNRPMKYDKIARLFGCFKKKL